MLIQTEGTIKKVKLGEYVVAVKGKKPKRISKEKTKEFSIPYVNIKAFEKNEIDEYTDGSGCVHCENNDFLMVWDGSRSGYVGKGIKGALGSTLMKLHFPNIEKDYAYYFLQSKFLDLNTKAKGVGIPHVDPHILWNYDLLIPEKEVQRVIVLKIEELFSELDKGIEELKTAQQQLKVYRQAVLKWAFEGRLTNQDVKDGELPEGWRLVKLNQIGSLFCGQSPSVSEVNRERKGILYVTGPEQWNGRHIEETKWTEYPKRIVPDGTIFITVKGAGVGKLFPGVKSAIGRDVYAYLPSEALNFKFSFYALKHSIDLVIMKAQGDIPGLTKDHILDHHIGICSMEEQKEVVDEIERRLSICDKIEETTTNSLKKGGALRQSILKRAFDGDLIKPNRT